MQIGLGLPTTIRGVPGEVILEWAQRADAANFSSLGMIDRLVYVRYPPRKQVGLSLALSTPRHRSRDTRLSDRAARPGQIYHPGHEQLLVLP